MPLLCLVLFMFALVLLVIAAFINPAGEPWRWRLLCLGLAFLAAGELVRQLLTLH